MKHKLWCSIILLVTVSIACARTAQARPDIFRDESLSAAQEEAKKANKFVVADFTATWCGPGKDMDKNTWTSPIVQKWIGDNAVAVQVDVDAERQVSDALNVHSMPTIVIFGPREPTAELIRQSGHQSPGQLFTWLVQVQTQEFLFGGLRRQVEALLGKSGAMQWAVTLGACLAGIIALLLFAKPASRKFNRMMQERVEDNWIKTPTKASPQNKLIEGKWAGTYTYAGSGNAGADNRADSTFAATLDGELTFSGHMIDSFGEATIVGAVDYPKVRFRKSYDKSAPGTKTASIFAVFYYEGRFSKDGQVTGGWFVSPWRKNTLRGSWQMKRSQG